MTDRNWLIGTIRGFLRINDTEGGHVHSATSAYLLNKAADELDTVAASPSSLTVDFNEIQRGRIAGLREAAEILRKHTGYLRTGLMSREIDLHVQQAAREIVMLARDVESQINYPATGRSTARKGTMKLGDRVRKRSGSSWNGRICGFYTTSTTLVGHCVESEREPGSVQIYPEAALELVGDGE